MNLFNKIKNIFSKNENEETKKYVDGLEKTRENFVNKLSLLGLKYNKVNDSFYDELEEILIEADLGVNVVLDFVDRLKNRVKKENITDFEYLKEIIVDELLMIYVNGEILSTKINYNKEGLTAILLVGVNGVGKTTTIAKLANKIMNEGKSVMMIAADTFRAGAVNQLEEWSKRVGCSFFGTESKDPASVVYDGINKAKEEKVDVVLIDTAGRLQNKLNLMKELEKINKVIGSLVENAPQETLLVIDASTGQNGINQAKEFNEITKVTGIVLTKIDGTSKGGIILSIKECVNIPVKFIGFGERIDDLMNFDIEKYIYGLFKEF